MNFDYTYLVLFGHLVFEPMVIFTNLLLFLASACFFYRLTRSAQPYAHQMAWFMLTLGISSIFGATAHGAHYLLGDLFFNTVFFLCNAFSLISIYFCFRAAYIYSVPQANKYIVGAVIAWISLLMIFSLVNGEFLLIKIHAGLVLVYSLIAHAFVYKRTHEKGSMIIVMGILFSFLSILVHSLKFSLSPWFNYKDIAHVIMIITLTIIYKGASQNVKKLDGKTTGR